MKQLWISPLYTFTAFLFLAFNSTPAQSQLQGRFLFDTFSIPGWPHIHSFSFATKGDKVLMVGGRKDGIHDKESGFDFTRSNTSMYLWDTKSQSILEYSIRSLPDTLISYLSSANTCFTQDENFLYILGGYGQGIDSIYHTYPVFIRIHLQNCIEAIQQSGDVLSSIEILQDPYFAVAGGQLRIKDRLFYLVGGHHFKGAYSSNSSKVDQVYTDAVRIFKVSKDSNSLQFEKVHEIKDDYNFHRRDFNLNPLIDEFGKLVFMVYSGVFQYNVNRPFLNLALVDGLQFREVLDFDQKFAAYNCSRLGFYEAKRNRMHQLFLGGMAEYYLDSTGMLVQDTYVPFVKTLSCVSRNESGHFEEYALRDQLPGYYGSNAEIFLNPETPLFKEDIIDWDALQGDTCFIGYLFGGIYNAGTDRNPWLNNLARTTVANPHVIKIQYLKNQSTGSEVFQNKKDTAAIQLYPNPAYGKTQLSFSGVPEHARVHLWIQNQNGDIIQELDLIAHSLEPYTLDIKRLIPGTYQLYALLNGTTLLKEKLQILNP